jgi:hypothetical protein
MEMNKDNLVQFRTDFTNLMKTLEERYDVSVQMGAIRYDKLEFTASMKVKNNIINGEDYNKVNYEKHCLAYKLKPEWLNQKFNIGPDTYKLIGINTSKRKNVCVIEDEDGKEYLTKPHVIIEKLGV